MNANQPAKADPVKSLALAPSPLLALPPEIRDLIWDVAVEWPDFTAWYATPGILLVNRQVTAEVLPILYAKPLVLRRPPLEKELKPVTLVNLEGFMTQVSFQNVRFMVLEMEVNVTETAISEMYPSTEWLEIVREIASLIPWRRDRVFEGLLARFDPEKGFWASPVGAMVLEVLCDFQKKLEKTDAVTLELTSECGVKVRKNIANANWNVNDRGKKTLEWL